MFAAVSYVLAVVVVSVAGMRAVAVCAAVDACQNY